MKAIKDVEKIKETVRKYISNGKSIGFIPTMGALHKGHLSLIEKAKEENDIVIVSIFVNPKQFNNPDDLKRYPRTLEQDIKLIEKTADIVFVPPAEEIYPPGFESSVQIASLMDIGEGSYRPGHFQGMATIVLKLFNLTQPTRAYFGKKDYQQYLIVRQMVRDLNVSVRIVGCETVRDENGLALSSRNMRLTEEGREKAILLYRLLVEAKNHILAGESDAVVIKKIIKESIDQNPDIRMEYTEVRRISDFQEVKKIQESSVILLAVYLEDVRLIDNIEISL